MTAYRSLVLLLAGFFIVGCATPKVVRVNEVGDGQLSCQQLIAEIQEAQRFEDEARGDRKVTGTNVAAAVLFWPALIATYANTEEAIEAAKDRQENLQTIYTNKRC